MGLVLLAAALEEAERSHKPGPAAAARGSLLAVARDRAGAAEFLQQGAAPPRQGRPGASDGQPGRVPGAQGDDQAGDVRLQDLGERRGGVGGEAGLGGEQNNERRRKEGRRKGEIERG